MVDHRGGEVHRQTSDLTGWAGDIACPQTPGNAVCTLGLAGPPATASPASQRGVLEVRVTLLLVPLNASCLSACAGSSVRLDGRAQLRGLSPRATSARIGSETVAPSHSSRGAAFRSRCSLYFVLAPTGAKLRLDGMVWSDGAPWRRATGHRAAGRTAKALAQRKPALGSRRRPGAGKCC